MNSDAPQGDTPRITEHQVTDPQDRLDVIEERLNALESEDDVSEVTPRPPAGETWSDPAPPPTRDDEPRPEQDAEVDPIRDDFRERTEAELAEIDIPGRSTHVE